MVEPHEFGLKENIDPSYNQRLTGLPEEERGPSETVSGKGRKRLPPHPGTRGRDAARDHANGDAQPITPEQREINTRGAALARSALRNARLK